jgi:hypothetical protein
VGGVVGGVVAPPGFVTLGVLVALASSFKALDRVVAGALILTFVLVALVRTSTVGGVVGSLELSTNVDIPLVLGEGFGPHTFVPVIERGSDSSE